MRTVRQEKLQPPVLSAPGQQMPTARIGSGQKGAGFGSMPPGELRCYLSAHPGGTGSGSLDEVTWRPDEETEHVRCTIVPWPSARGLAVCESHATDAKCLPVRLPVLIIQVNMSAADGRECRKH